jgi:hypothetical protein
MNLFDTNFLFASLIWGSVGFAYATYGWKQGRPVPLVGGLVMMAASYVIGSALLMSLGGIAIIVGVYWLLRRGY